MSEKAPLEANPDLTVDSELTTASRVRTWFMVQFKGYTVVQRREIPRVTRHGRLTYDYLWDLRPPSGAKVPGSSGRDGAKS